MQRRAKKVNVRKKLKIKVYWEGVMFLQIPGMKYGCESRSMYSMYEFVTNASFKMSLVFTVNVKMLNVETINM